MKISTTKFNNKDFENSLHIPKYNDIKYHCI